MLGVSDQEDQDQLNVARMNPYIPERDSGPGFFEGMGPSLAGRGLGLGVAETGLAMAKGVNWLRNQIPESMQTAGPFDPEGTSPRAASAQQVLDLQGVVNNLRPDPKTTGFAGQTIEGIQSVLSQAEMGGGSKIGAAAVIGPSQGSAAYDEAIAQGVDPKTAAGMATITGAGNAVMPFVPFAFGGGPLLRAATGAGVNTAFGAAMRGTTSAYLDSKGYKDIAAQYRILDGQGILSDMVLGSFFGALHASPKKAGAAPDGVPPGPSDGSTPPPSDAGPTINQPLPSDVDAALTIKSAQLYRDAAPGVPVDAEAINSHDAAMQTAAAQLLTDQPVDVGGKLNGEFIPRQANPDAIAAFDQALHENGYYALAEEIKAQQQQLNDLGLPVDETDELRQPINSVEPTAVPVERRQPEPNLTEETATHPEYGLSYKDALTEVAKRRETIAIKSPEREALRQKVAADLYGSGAKQKNGIIHIVMGAPGAGKTSAIVARLLKKFGAIEIDPDLAKERLPEYDHGLGTNAVHKESTLIARNADYSVFSKALDNNDNIVLPIVGHDAAALSTMIDALHNKGYDVHVHHVEVTPENSAKRVLKRFAETGRIVAPDFQAKAAKVGTAYEKIKAKPEVKGFSKINNDARVPRLVESNAGSPIGDVLAERGIGPGRRNDTGQDRSGDATNGVETSEPLRQIFGADPDVQIPGPDGQDVKASDALAQADDDIKAADETSNLMEVAAGCASRFL